MRFVIPILAMIAAIALPLFADSQTGGSTIDLIANRPPATSVYDAVAVVREGTHFVDRTGHLNHTLDGMQTLLTFDNDGPGTPASPMIVLPNLKLFAMENVISSRGTRVRFRVSGTVTEYKGRDYILVETVQTTLMPSPVDSPPAVAVPQTSVNKKVPTVVDPANDVTASSQKVGSAERAMDRLLAPLPTQGQDVPIGAGTLPVNDSSTGKTAVAPDAPMLPVIREGTHLINRIGRLNHSSDGQQAVFTFDSDGKTMGDAPLIILPNALLSTMETGVLIRSSDVHFRISGTITEYKGRNYILLDKAVVTADIETQF